MTEKCCQWKKRPYKALFTRLRIPNARPFPRPSFSYVPMRLFLAAALSASSSFSTVAALTGRRSIEVTFVCDPTQLGGMFRVVEDKSQCLYRWTFATSAACHPSGPTFAPTTSPPTAPPGPGPNASAVVVTAVAVGGVPPCQAIVDGTSYDLAAVRDAGAFAGTDEYGNDIAFAMCHPSAEDSKCVSIVVVVVLLPQRQPF